MRRIPLSRFRRELNQHIRNHKQLMLTRNGKDAGVWIPVQIEEIDLGEDLIKGIKECIEHAKGNLQLKTTRIK